jgi:glycosyltransferase involved in cell wall biosynthesis
MISIVTGTLNRLFLLPRLIENTVDSNEKLELVLVDGGSTDGTIEYIKSLNHPRINLIEVGKRSTYPHFMNLGIKNSKHDIICQWNDDVLLSNDWNEIFSEIDDEHDFYLFNWKNGNPEDIKNPQWLYGHNHEIGHWFLMNNMSTNSNTCNCCINPPVDGNYEIVMNYGLYKKHIFKEIGMYNYDYTYYGADADMANRAYRFGYKVKDLRNIKVCALPVEKRAILYLDQDVAICEKNKKLYKENFLPKESIEFLS